MDAFVAQHLQGVSRTYAIVVPMLPPPLDHTVGLAYLLMRMVDTVEDATALSPAERSADLDRLEAALAGDEAAIAALARPLGDTPDECALMQAAPEVFTRLQALPDAQRAALIRCARAMIAGVRQLMARSAERGLTYPAVRDMAELREYCYYVAGVVGEMLYTLMSRHIDRPEHDALRTRAVELGTGLQLVNILKDAPADSVHGRRYLPLVQSDGTSAADIYDAALQTARGCLREGVEYILALPASQPGLRRFCGLPVVWGALTLNRAARDASAAKIDRDAIYATIAQFERVAADDTALRTWLTDLLDPQSAQSPAPTTPLPPREG
jgi:farnesyl-diphosphate farnesyltransferase